MRITIPLNHAKYFWWGKGWGQKPRKNTDNFYYRMIWKAKSRRPLEVIEQSLPDGAQPVNANVFIKNEFEREFQQLRPFVLPWPYSKRPIKGTCDDPYYKEKTALVYQRNKRVVEPVKLPLYFTNSILQLSLPGPIQEFQSKIDIEDEFVDYCKRRIEWALNHDSQLRKLPIDKEFPYMDQNPPRVYGTTVSKKELNLLQTLYDISNYWNSRTFGFNTNIILQRISYPNCVYPIERDGKFAILDLECDFMSLLSPANKQPLKKCSFDPDFLSNSTNQPLQSISPISWEVGFDSKNFYREEFEFKIPAQSEIQTIFLSNNSVRKLEVEDYQGRALMFCYGYAMQQAKIKQQNHLELPITIQCLYTSPKDFKIGFVLFQLNSLEFDNECRNQAWFSEPKSILDETRDSIKDLCTMQSFRMNSIN